jgi:hypothetical protein
VSCIAGESVVGDSTQALLFSGKRRVLFSSRPRSGTRRVAVARA